ncbi:MAG: hypothetical protein K2X47_00530 [Bdellovibrionales bacterium]|nr:hypothetical protein [Bdellovibrionales bacterium]
MKLFLSILTLLIYGSAFSATPREGYSLKTKLNYKSGTKKDISATKEIILPTGTFDWVPLTDIQDEVVLLGRVAQTTDSSVKVEYMLIDGHKKPSTIVSTPSILARLNEAAEISITAPDNRSIISISLMVKATTFVPESAVQNQ